jgi:hypothetical protein
MKRLLRPILFVTISAWIGGHPAQAAPAQMTVSLSQTAGAVKATAVAGVDFQSPIDIGTDGVDLTITAGAGLLPAKVGLTCSVATLPRPTISGNNVTYHLAAPSTEATLEVQYDSKDIQAIQVAAPGPSGGVGQGQSAVPTSSVKDLLKTSCANVPDATAAPNVVNIVTTPIGNVIKIDSPDGAITEADTVVVQVVADLSLLPYLRIVRSSALRLGGGINILGADVTIPGGFIRKGAKQTAPTCGVVKVVLTGFAPGKGTIDISAQTGSDQVALGTIELAVHPLYTGMFSLGGAWSSVTDPQFSVVSNGTNNVVSATETGNRRLLYTLFYTPFLWGPRDIQRSTPWFHHLNLTVGLALNDPLNNAFAGLSVDLLSSVVLTVGGVVSHVSELDPSSGLSAGSKFAGMASDLPVTHSWKTGHFFAVSIDLRAAVQLIQMVLGTAKS